MKVPEIKCYGGLTKEIYAFLDTLKKPKYGYIDYISSLTERFGITEEQAEAYRHEWTIKK